jgi:hypothetical protein
LGGKEVGMLQLCGLGQIAANWGVIATWKSQEGVGCQNRLNVASLNSPSPGCWLEPSAKWTNEPMTIVISYPSAFCCFKVS